MYNLKTTNLFSNINKTTMLYYYNKPIAEIVKVMGKYVQYVTPSGIYIKLRTDRELPVGFSV